MKVLIADDDRVFVELLATRLRAEGFQVVAAFDAMQAIMHAVRSAPDVIVLDLRMPGGNGLDVLRKIKTSTRGGSVPVIVATSLDDPGLGAALKAQGAAGLVRKPADITALMGMVHHLVGTAAVATK